MKKPVIIIISLIYIIAIAVVGFLGIPARVFNPMTFVQDIEIVADDKLEVLEHDSSIDYYYRIYTSDVVTFNITARALPNNTSYKRCTFNKLDQETFYTYSVDFTNEVTIATFTCQAPSKRPRTISISVGTTDGNKQLTKKIEIVVKRST